jgi:hypothetical protein
MGLAELLVTLTVVVSAIGVMLWRAQRELTLFVLRVDGGHITGIKGRLPRRLLGDIADVIRQERLMDLRIRCRIEERAARLHVYGDSNAGFEQLLRNLVGEYPLQRLRQAPRSKL